jgi:threonine dehydrogenase-like Zn-dependent dehydrogenase
VISAELARMVRSATSSLIAGDQLTGGMPLIVDCVGSADSLAQSLQVVAPGGEILLVGMPASVSVNLTSLWHREVAVRGCYAYQRADFDTAIDVVRRFELGRLVTQAYPLDDYADAIEHAANAGRRGAVKIAFDLRTGTRDESV